MDLTGATLGLLVALFDMILIFYGLRMLRSIYKQPETAMTKLFLKEKAVNNFKMLARMLVLYGVVGPLVGGLIFFTGFQFEAQYRHVPLMVALISLGGLVYFQRNLYCITAPNPKNEATEE